MGQGGRPAPRRSALRQREPSALGCALRQLVHTTAEALATKADLLAAGDDLILRLAFWNRLATDIAGGAGRPGKPDHYGRPEPTRTAASALTRVERRTEPMCGVRLHTARFFACAEREIRYVTWLRRRGRSLTTALPPQCDNNVPKESGS